MSLPFRPRRAAGAGARPGAAALAAGAAALVLALAAGAAHLAAGGRVGRDGGRTAFVIDHDAIVRGDASVRRLALIFTGGDFGEGGEAIRRALRGRGIKAGFFFTGDFYRAPAFAGLIRGLVADGHYLGPHSDRHLLYCPWDDRDRTLVTREEFQADLEANFREMARFGIAREKGHLFIPPYEWYNRTIAAWARKMRLTLFNFTPGTSSNADYTTPDMPEYLPSQAIFDRILAYEKSDPHGLNGFILLVHIGTDPARSDKLYSRLGDLIDALSKRGYEFVRIDKLLGLD
jgi:peptidoglycan/xylan/chitin deacetylase (PgdA/CDA1 family)